jgi:hypothetical protein
MAVRWPVALGPPVPATPFEKGRRATDASAAEVTLFTPETEVITADVGRSACSGVRSPPPPPPPPEREVPPW